MTDNIEISQSPQFPNAEQIKQRMDEQKERQAAQEKDSFYKTALVAYVANFFAHNTAISTEQIVQKCSLLAELTWDALVAHREKQK